MTDSITQANADQSRFYARVAAENHGDPRPDARPEWGDLSAEEQDLHREECDTASGVCAFCEKYRAWGECSTCRATAEAIGPDELSRCCGSKVALTAPEIDDLRERWAA